MITTTAPLIQRAVVERPILFQGEMICSYQQRRKTQTRRTRGLEHVNQDPDAWYPTIMGVFVDRFAVTFQHRTQDITRMVFCPYGKPGDALWARETWQINHVLFDSGPIPKTQPDEISVPDDMLYRADGEFADQFEIDEGGSGWRPSIFMPRWASRYTLPITEIRCERVQDITEADAEAEGIIKPAWDNASYRVEFARLWDTINAKRGLGWKHNPWCWPVSFPAYVGSPCVSS